MVSPLSTLVISSVRWGFLNSSSLVPYSTILLMASLDGPLNAPPPKYDLRLKNSFKRKYTEEEKVWSLSQDYPVQVRIWFCQRWGKILTEDIIRKINFGRRETLILSERKKDLFRWESGCLFRYPGKTDTDRSADWKQNTDYGSLIAMDAISL